MGQGRSSQAWGVVAGRVLRISLTGVSAPTPPSSWGVTLALRAIASGPPLHEICHPPSRTTPQLVPAMFARLSWVAVFLPRICPMGARSGCLHASATRSAKEKRNMRTCRWQPQGLQSSGCCANWRSSSGRGSSSTSETISRSRLSSASGGIPLRMASRWAISRTQWGFTLVADPGVVGRATTTWVILCRKGSKRWAESLKCRGLGCPRCVTFDSTKMNWYTTSSSRRNLSSSRSSSSLNTKPS
mmetsp:Transcript_61616/g.165001  ORF Transcript_61616/g.165001 Transcript_61616/m.165001 type:complete len:244 (+) Transcript_61616:128-859(+)